MFLVFDTNIMFMSVPFLSETFFSVFSFLLAQDGFLGSHKHFSHQKFSFLSPFLSSASLAFLSYEFPSIISPGQTAGIGHCRWGDVCLLSADCRWHVFVVVCLFVYCYSSIVYCLLSLVFYMSSDFLHLLSIGFHLSSVVFHPLFVVRCL